MTLSKNRGRASPVKVPSFFTFTASKITELQWQVQFEIQKTTNKLLLWLLLLLLLLWGTSQSKVALANARDLSGSRERMPKSTLSLPKYCFLFITVAGHFNQCPTVSGSSLHLLHVGASGWRWKLDYLLCDYR